MNRPVSVRYYSRRCLQQLVNRLPADVAAATLACSKFELLQVRSELRRAGEADCVDDVAVGVVAAGDSADRGFVVRRVAYGIADMIAFSSVVVNLTVC